MNKDQSLYEQINAHLDKSIDDLDPGLKRKIARARTSALEQGPELSFWDVLKRPVAGAAAAAVVILLYVGLSNYAGKHSGNPDIGQLEMLEMLSSDQGFEFYENIEFLTWLAEESGHDLDS